MQLDVEVSTPANASYTCNLLNKKINNMFCANLPTPFPKYWNPKLFQNPLWPLAISNT